MKPIFVDIQGARSLYPGNTPFTVRLIFRGWNDKRNCMSDCWWTIENKDGVLLCNWGKTGSSGRARPSRYTFQQAVKKIQSKLEKGYVYDARTKYGPVTAAPKNPLEHMPAPFCDIQSVVKEGGKWKALGADGHVISVLPASSALDIQELLGA